MATNTAPGKPGMLPRWTSSAKIGIGTALNNASNVWFTISHGIINEVYCPRIDLANIRDLGLIVTDGKEFFSEEKRDCVHDYYTLGDGIPAYHLINSCQQQRYRIEKRVIVDPGRNSLLQEVTFIPLQGELKDYRIYALIAPHIRNEGADNDAWTDQYKGIPVLFAQHNGTFIALSSSSPFVNSSCGYVGNSDPWQDLHRNKKFTQCYQQASGGNVALAGEIDLQACGGRFVIALSFGLTSFGAALQSRLSLIRPFDLILKEYVSEWEAFQENFIDLAHNGLEGAHLFRISNTVIKIHEGKINAGAVIASLSIPWGFAKGDNDLGGYHLIWPRDQIMTAVAMLSAGEVSKARATIQFLICTQESNGHWAQCLWADGSPYWIGLQMDETALPILLADHLKRQNLLEAFNVFEMVAKAASFLLKNGPVTQQDRWEEESGYTPFTIATEIAGLLAAADFFDDNGKRDEADYLRACADYWNDSIERWIYVTGTSLAKENGVDGYYARVAPAEQLEDRPPKNTTILLKNLPEGENLADYRDIISCDALALVRYGLRSPHDEKILNTIKVIDKLLKTETSKGPIWHRYNRDGYGEKADGSPYDGTGIGRVWPLLVGERAHYEVIKGDLDRAKYLFACFSRFAGEGGLIPEQIWDSDDIPERGLFKGHSAGSAKPLVWAHAEYLTLLRSIQDGKSFSTPPQTVQRYLTEQTKSKHVFWRYNHKSLAVPKGKIFRIQTEGPGSVHWSSDDWKNVHDTPLQGNAFGIYFADIDTTNLNPGDKIIFTFHWQYEDKWEGTNFAVTVTTGT